MKKQSFFLLWMILALTNTLYGQADKNQPVAIATAKGIWLYLGNEIPKDTEYQIYRKQEKEEYRLVGSVRFNNSLENRKVEIDKYNHVFPDLEEVTGKEIEKVLVYGDKSSIVDSMVISNFPVMHLMLGTAFFDFDVQKEKNYLYKVRKINAEKGLEYEGVSNSAHLPVDTSLVKPVFLSKEELADRVLLRWYMPEQGNLNSFVVYRRVFGLGDYRKIDAVKGFSFINDSLQLIAMDTTVISPGFYEYYLKPLDIYGNSGTVSDIVRAVTRTDRANSVPLLFKAKGIEKDHQIVLNWKFTDTKYIRSIDIFRSMAFDSGFHKIARVSPDDTSYIDDVPVGRENYYYYLVTNDVFDTKTSTATVSAMYKSTIEKPFPPGEVDAETVPDGVKIHWSSNEPYLKGFYVYRYVYEKAAYEQASGFIPVGNGRLYSFVDSSGILVGNEVYRYAVKSVNDLGQFSDFSPAASARPGLKASVATPINVSITSRGNGVMLIWDDLGLVEPNLLGYKIYRKLRSEKAYTILPNDTVNRTKNYFTDSTLMTGGDYMYAIAAIDLYGNESAKSLPVYFARGKAAMQPPQIHRAVNSKEGILVEWGVLQGKDVSVLKLYRTEEGGVPELVGTLNPEKGQFLDKTVMDGRLYIYELALVGQDKYEGPKGRGVSIRRQQMEGVK